MTTKTHDKPLFGVTFSRITGKDDKGNDVLAKPKEIGAIWPRKNGGILSLDLIPVELAQRQGVLFVLPVDTNDNGGLAMSLRSAKIAELNDLLRTTFLSGEGGVDRRDRFAG